MYCWSEYFAHPCINSWSSVWKVSFSGRVGECEECQDPILIQIPDYAVGSPVSQILSHYSPVIGTKWKIKCKFCTMDAPTDNVDS